MPKAVESCVSSLLAEWKRDPSKRPAPRKKGQKQEEQAWAICTAAHNKSVKASLEAMLESGEGPALLGAAATNRPYIPHLKPTQVVEIDGKKKFLVHLANSGHFGHPLGAFTLNRAVFLTMQNNLRRKVTGQDAAYDAHHKPDAGALGWFDDLLLGDQVKGLVGGAAVNLEFGPKEFWGLVDPTPVGLELIEGGIFKYSSMEFQRNYKRDDVRLDLERATEDFCIVLESAEDAGKQDNTTGGNMSDNNDAGNDGAGNDGAIKLQQQLEAANDKVKELERREQEAADRALKLEQMAISDSISGVIKLAQDRRDDEGNGLPKQLIVWVASVLKFEGLGEGDDAIRLSEDEHPSFNLQRYLISAVKALILEMPGYVPAKRHGHSGQDDSGGDGDDFDYKAEWE